MNGNGIPEHLIGDSFTDVSNVCGIFATVLWYDKGATSTTGYYHIGSMH